jgi:hypothetical protein
MLVNRISPLCASEPIRFLPGIEDLAASDVVVPVVLLTCHLAAREVIFSIPIWTGPFVGVLLRRFTGIARAPAFIFSRERFPSMGMQSSWI